MENITISEDLLEIFNEETKNLIDEMKQDMSILSQPAQTVDQVSVLKRLFRCAHIIKSSSRSVGLDSLDQISGALERIFKKAGDADIMIESDTISLLCESVEACQNLLVGEEVAAYKELTDRLGSILKSYGE
jgi:two-component system chemotaxis sensor kinase CheA